LLLNDNNIQKLRDGDIKTLARLISIVENASSLSQEWLQTLQPNSACKVIGITGAPGAGKSTLTNSLIVSLLQRNEKIAVISIDPSSPFNYGALLGDRIRMSEHFLNPNVYIRSLASRGALGGLSKQIFEVIDVVKCAGFDSIILETVGIGQSEVDIAGVADTTVVVVVPEGGDEVQTMKAGVLEIADIFVVNKSDRPNADEFVHNLKALSHSKMSADGWTIPVHKTQADKNIGVIDLCDSIVQHNAHQSSNESKRNLMLAEKAYQLIAHQRMANINLQNLSTELQDAQKAEGFNLYKFIQKFN
jgi:LAO/AO transport system kinase